VSNINCVQSSSDPPTSETGFIYYSSNHTFWFTLDKGQAIDVQFSGTSSCGQEYATRTFYVPPYYYTLYPNPVQNTVTIISNNLRNNLESMKIKGYSPIKEFAIKQVRIYDAGGKLQLQRVFSGNKTKVQMDISSLTNGIYFVVINDGKYTATQKLVIGK
jgi:hypothetical protein